MGSDNIQNLEGVFLDTGAQHHPLHRPTRRYDSFILWIIILY
jgi:hypothetical protein